MYRDAAYGQNWQPRANNARRIDPYTRSIKSIAILFAIGFVLIVIVVLSLIPLYISRSSSLTANNAQVPKVFVNNYNIRLQSPVDDFNAATVLSSTSNRRTLQAALTAMLQTDSNIAGSIVEIVVAAKRRRRRRQTSASRSITFDLNVISGKGCSSLSCLNLFQSRAMSCLTDARRVTANLRYEQPDTKQVYWLGYKLPTTGASNATFVIVDTKTIAATLDSLLQLDKSFSLPTAETSTTTTTAT